MRTDGLLRRAARSRRLGSGKVRIPLLVAGLMLALLLFFVVLPYPLGIRAESVYRDYFASVRQTGMHARVTSYHRGWFSSDSTAIIVYGGRQLLVKSHISHGPFVLSGADASIRPVAAVVDSTLDLAPAANSNFKLLSGAPHLIEARAIIQIDGTADISGALAPFSYSDAHTGQTLKLTGARWKSRIAGIHVHMTATLDGFESATRGADVHFGKSLTVFDGAKDPSGLWLGTVTSSMSNSEYRFSPKLPSGKTMKLDEHFSNVRIRGRTWRDGSMMRAEENFSIGRGEFGSGQWFSVDFGLRAANLDPTAIAEWVKRNAPMFQTPPAKQNIQARQLSRKCLTLATTLAKNNPHCAVTLNLHGSFGTIIADASGGLKPAMASDPELAQADGSAASWKLVNERYVYGSGEVKLPTSMRALFSSGKPHGDWMNQGYITQEGDHLVSRFKFDDGHFSLNGHQVF